MRTVTFNGRHSETGTVEAGYRFKSEEHLGVSYRNGNRVD